MNCKIKYVLDMLTQACERRPVHAETGVCHADPSLANLPPRTLESFRRDFPEQVRSAASRCRSEQGLDEVKVVAHLTGVVESGLATDCSCRPICLEEFEKGRRILVNFVILVCGHRFHYHCIDTCLDMATKFELTNNTLISNFKYILFFY